MALLYLIVHNVSQLPMRVVIVSTLVSLYSVAGEAFVQVQVQAPR